MTQENEGFDLEKAGREAQERLAEAQSSADAPVEPVTSVLAAGQPAPARRKPAKDKAPATKKPRKETRSENTQRRRRRRGSFGNRLELAQNELDQENFSYRWINGEEFRMLQMTQYDDWERVPQSGGSVKEDADDGYIQQHVGNKADGSPLIAYLCRKPKQWYDDDQAEKMREVNRKADQIRMGRDEKGAPLSDYAADNHSQTEGFGEKIRA